MTGPSRFEFPAHVADSPFQRLAALIADHQPGAQPIDLAVGGPRHAIPPFVAETIAAQASGFGPYPAIKGTKEFRAAVAGWLDRRFATGSLIDPMTSILPLNGSREGLYFASLGAAGYLRKEAGQQPVVFVPNPGYPAYAVGAYGIGAEVIPYVPSEPGGVMPDWGAIDPAVLDRTVAVFVGSPSNPQGACATRQDWADLLERARAHRFMVFADECYSEIYREAAGPPAGALDAAAKTGSLDNLVVFNSLSKRSSLPGLRCGFAAGDPAFLAHWARLRNVAAPQVPAPMQAVAAEAYRDEAHVAENRRLYDAKFAKAELALGALFSGLTPPGGFFLWLDVSAYGDDAEVTRRMWTEAGVRSVPGSYLGAPMPDGSNPGAGRVRLALVQDETATEEAVRRLADMFGTW
ncbi:aminotransferase class I/II-fold pyridoxal phosphate-dependent enzyme [Amorphus orientalis]|uniref:Aspartate/methionine/tyrosine aminotransferase n=1 Tax=Amorphus orientalis TaxID=649198 RepID=A0AAE3VRI5_9HYPH|nr:aminotransferase class I/II-fold pyridoxal phosphate-dependent enzyme [Amorphus orientalis]MDQ0317042.1 aspartate/methionine/tyrosine aminotransferase [Amorphus orientalis]